MLPSPTVLRRHSAHLAALLTTLSILCPALLAQRVRISDSADQNRKTALGGNISPHAIAQFDQGFAEPSLKLGRITLMFKPSVDQQADLERLLEEQQNPLSPNYLAWLTPEQYADRFGLNQSDLRKIAAWLESQGFTIEDIARGRNWIAFSGSVGQVQAAFLTEIHRYNVDGELHVANSGAPSVPADFAPVVLGIMGLDDFYPKPPRRQTVAINRFHPDFTNGSSHYIAPDDLATIYDLWPLYNLGYFGNGQRIVVVGKSDFYLADITNFRALFNLPMSVPTKIPVVPVPGIDPQSMPEADFDLEWTGAIARNANLVYVYSTNPIYAVMYAVNNAVAPIISYSFAQCEMIGNISAAQQSRLIAQQANAQGITWVASSGDEGAAGCDTPETLAGLAVNLPASIPEVTGVGGTKFNEGSGNYWGSNGASGGSALSYIPEIAWNDTNIGPMTLAASGGGQSIFFPKPIWQSGPGVPNDGVRDVPDLALTASANHDGYMYCTNGSCVLGSTFGGTSASTPVFAGILGLVDQYELAQSFQTTAGLGNVNPTLYRLAQTVPSVFHDITIGNNIVPCLVGTVNCTTGFFGYSAGPGYDLVTGLGSIDASNLIASWHTAAPISSDQATLSLSSNSLNFGTNGSLITSPQEVTVSITNGIGVSWTASSNQPNISISPTTGSGSGNFLVTVTPGPSGVITLRAFGASNSPQVISVNVSTATTAVPYGSFDTPVNNTRGIGGAIPVTGWVLDSIEATNVGIWREPVTGETPQANGLVFLGTAVFVAGARPDVQATYPNAPFNYRAGWGHMLLTNFLVNGNGSGPLGNGTYKLHAIVTNKAGQTLDLGTRTITVDNAHASKPFGTIDTPGQGGTVSGSAYVNFGWALTQNPYVIPTDGSTITVILDGVALGHPVYNNYRSDIANLFPGLANSNGAVGFFNIDTTQLANGVHTISWNVFDNAGRGDGIGSRYITVANVGTENQPASEGPVLAAPNQTVTLIRDLNVSRIPEALTPKENGEYFIAIEELERIELRLGATAGYLVVNGERRNLPIGSSLKGGVFHWQVGPGFLGDFELEFERSDRTTVQVRVRIQPKTYSQR